MHNLGRQFNGRGALWTCRHPPATTTSYTPFPILTPMNDDEWTGSGPSNRPLSNTTTVLQWQAVPKRIIRPSKHPKLVSCRPRQATRLHLGDDIG